MKIKMKTELRECPFCAGTDLLATDSFQGNPMQNHVYCKSCGTNWVCINKNWNHRPIEDGLRAEIEALQKELAELKEKYRWHKIADDGLPELDQDVEIINMRTMEMQAGHFFDYNEGEPEPDIMFDDHNDTTFALSELPKKYQWRYLNAPEQGE